jgi:hypothetical protein
MAPSGRRRPEVWAWRPRWPSGRGPARLLLPNPPPPPLPAHPLPPQCPREHGRAPLPGGVGVTGRALSLWLALCACGVTEVQPQHQHVNDRLLFGLTSTDSYRAGIGAAYPPQPFNFTGRPNEARFANATVLQVIESNTGVAATTAPWKGPLLGSRSRLQVGCRAVDHETERLYTVAGGGVRLRDNATLISAHLISGGERTSHALPFFPVSPIGYHDGYIIALKQNCHVTVGGNRWCRTVVRDVYNCGECDITTSALQPAPSSLALRGTPRSLTARTMAALAGEVTVGLPSTRASCTRFPSGESRKCDYTSPNCSPQLWLLAATAACAQPPPNFTSCAQAACMYNPPPPNAPNPWQGSCGVYRGLNATNHHVWTPANATECVVAANTDYDGSACRALGCAYRPAVCAARDSAEPTGLSVVVVNTTGHVLVERRLPGNVTRALPGLATMDSACLDCSSQYSVQQCISVGPRQCASKGGNWTGVWYVAVLQSDAPLPRYPLDTRILAFDPTNGTLLPALSFSFPHGLLSLETMRYVRSRIVFQPMSTVLTQVEYYEQVVLTGLLYHARQQTNLTHPRTKPRYFAVNPETGEECANARCVPDSQLSAADVQAQQQLANAAASNIFAGIVSATPLDTAKEMFLMSTTTDDTNREMITVYRDQTGVRRLAAIEIADNLNPGIGSVYAEYDGSTAALVVHNVKPAINVIDTPDLQLTPDVAATSLRAQYTYAAYTPPSTVTLAQSWGPVGGNTTIHILGNHMPATDDLRCKFGNTVGQAGTFASLYIDDRPAVQCLSPNSGGYAGPVAFQIIHVGTSATATALQFTFYNEPVVQLIFPVAGGWSGGSTAQSGISYIKLSGPGFFHTPLTLCR